mmetsp:Transcript_31411/g.62701  ORF Transcript_31411/g.62701 Transcript_31411/m.62701 type:complete len:297 (-) Transcript_31411:152-1042(-)
MALQEDTILAAKADEFRNDSPCISGAMKSYLTVLLAEEVTRPPIPVVRHIRDGVDLTPPVAPTMNQKDVMDCARVVLQLVNAYEPPTEAEWAENHPQGEEETASARLDAVAEFRVARVLAAHVLKAAAASSPPSSGKVTKLFGRKFLVATKCWESTILPAAEAALGLVAVDGSLPQSSSSPPSSQRSVCVPRDTAKAFLDGWGRTLVSGEGGDHEGIASLVWAKDFSKELQNRRMARSQEVQSRNDRSSAAASRHEKLKRQLNEQQQHDLTCNSSAAAAAAATTETPAAERAANIK